MFYNSAVGQKNIHTYMTFVILNFEGHVSD